MFLHDNIRKTFIVMHTPVYEESDTLSFVLLACNILYINGKQIKCSVFTFVHYITDAERTEKNAQMCLSSGESRLGGDEGVRRALNA